ncbi:hypothetical protein SAMN04488111_2161 [Lutibacter flavus]|uniref:Uncharacterized protein n=1 Tax=Lutibacter flavus TaxID=691689 RepID=A0A238XVC8_9FLAO|nr:hypothetical protein SAMN04488111_2161 [Lutibacter flavus]
MNILLEVFNKFMTAKRECYSNHYISQFWGKINIVENTMNNLEFTILPPDWELNTVEFTFIKSDKTLNLTFCIYDEYDSLILSTESVLIKSIVDVNEFSICNVDKFLFNKKSYYF